MTDKELLRKVARKIELWATESQTGGWSTQHVEAQKQLANEIWAHIGRYQATHIVRDKWSAE